VAHVKNNASGDRARRTSIIILAAAFLFLLILPVLIQDRIYILHLFAIIYLNSIIMLGLVIILGYTKQFSLGQVAFYGIGAYTTAILTTHYGVNFFVALVLSGFAGAAAAVLVAIPATRFQGPWLALVTFAFAEIIRILMIRLKGLTGGFGGFFGIPKPSIGDFAFDNNFRYYYICLLVLAAVLAAACRVRRSPYGRIWLSMGDNEVLASSLGVNVFYHKLLAFSVGSFFAGVAGSLYAGYANFISPDNFTIGHTIYYLSILIVGGIESISGVIAATVIFTLFSSYLRALYPWDMVIFGLIIVLFVNFLPGGIGERFDSLRQRFQAVFST
jgi:branched-chain amino acid transport system permease protein